MTLATETPPTDLAATAIRAIVLHSLLEFQSGNATTIRVTKHRSEFSVADDGRGHPLDKELEGISYLRFIYTHFDYPFESTRGAPIQLQGIGMSFINSICSELVLTVRKPSETLTATFKDGAFQSTDRRPGVSAETGITVQARLRPELTFADAGPDELVRWLRDLVQVHPTLRLFFNGSELHDRRIVQPRNETTMVTACRNLDQPGWLALRQQLWPHCTREEHLEEMASHLAERRRFAQFMEYDAAGAALGFIEISLRSDYVNGADSSPVAFLEGIFVAPEARGTGVARRLVAEAEHWAKFMGCKEFASDAKLENTGSQAMHAALGFVETERVVFFKKPLA